MLLHHSKMQTAPQLPFAHQPSRAGTASEMTNPCQQELPEHPHAFFHKRTNSQQPQTMDSNEILKSLFGTSNASWDRSDETLAKALELRICQEKTKQEYYRVEALNRSIELMKLVAVAKVPVNLIPCVFNQPSQASLGPVDGPVVSFPPNCTPDTSGIALSGTSSPLQSPVSPSPRRVPHVRCRTVSNLADLREQQNPQSFNASSQSMSSFKFGSGSSPSFAQQQRRSSLAPKHQLSPSRIGAHAISSLGSGVRKPNTGGNLMGSSSNNHASGSAISLQRLRHGSSHQRTLSLPASVSIPESQSMQFHSHDGYTQRNTGAGSIVIPDLTGRTPNASLIQKKRKVSNVQGFEYYKPVVSGERHSPLLSSGENKSNDENANNATTTDEEEEADVTIDDPAA